MKVLILLLTYCEFLIYCLVAKDSSPNIPRIKLTFIPRKIKNTANTCGVCVLMVAPAGFEPATF